jgi:two-component system, NtrC family, nitrogen regulation sensor histidine kinase GlnL
MISPEAIINNIDEVVCLFDAHLKIAFINKAGEEFFGRSSGELQGRPLGYLFPNSDDIGVLLRNSLNEGRLYNSRETELDIGRIVNVDMHISPLYVQAGIEGAILCMRDNRFTSERDDYQFDHMLYLLGSIAHEIKNPLSGIKGAAQILKANPGSRDAEECVNLVLKEADRLNAALLGYLTMTRLPRFHQVNIHEALEHAVSVMLADIKGGGVGIEKSYDPSLPCISGDEGKLLQVFINLVKNAVEAMEPVRHKKTLMISTRLSDEYMLTYGEGGIGSKGKRLKKQRWVVIGFGDTGVGLNKEEIGRIFLPFYTNKKKGSGFGLSLSKKIIKDHGGIIRVKSSSAGSTFSVYLPLEPTIA